MQERKLIYLVDDDAEDREFIREVFSEINENCEFLFFDEGTSLISYIENGGFEKPDIIITDLKLPKIDGLEIIRFLREKPELKSVPIVVHTVSSFPPEKELAFKAGASYYITKAYSYDELVEVVSRINTLAFSSAS